jgi:hypothetical protein
MICPRATALRFGKLISDRAIVGIGSIGWMRVQQLYWVDPEREDAIVKLRRECATRSATELACPCSKPVAHLIGKWWPMLVRIWVGKDI